MRSTQKSPESTHTSNRARTNSQDSGDMMLPPQVGKGSPSRRAADARRALWSNDKINQAAEAHRAEKVTQAQQGQANPQGAVGPQAESVQSTPAPNASAEMMQSPASAQSQVLDTSANTAADQSIVESQDQIDGVSEGEEATQCPDLVYQPISSAIAAQFEKCTGENVSDVLIAENPELEKIGKRGVAKDGCCIEVVPGCLNDVELCAHELTHVVQQRGPSKISKLSSSNNTSVENAAKSVEDEAKSVANLVINNQKTSICISSYESVLYEDPKGDSCSLKNNEIIPVDDKACYNTSSSDLSDIGVDFAVTPLALNAIEDTIANHFDGLKGDLVSHYLQGNGGIFHLNYEHMKYCFPEIIDLSNTKSGKFKKIIDEYPNSLQNMHQQCIPNYGEYDEDEEACIQFNELFTSPIPGALGDFTICFKGTLGWDQKMNVDNRKRWTFDGSMYFYDRWDFDWKYINMDFSRDLKTEITTMAGSVLMPGGCGFDVRSEVVSITQKEFENAKW